MWEAYVAAINTTALSTTPATASHFRTDTSHYLTPRIFLCFQFGEQEKGPMGQLVPTNSPIRWRD